MPLPLILGIGAAIAGATGIGMGVHGAVQMKDAKDTMEEAQARQKKNEQRLERTNKKAIKSMDILGQKELTILNGFQEFSDVMAKIQNKPTFAAYEKNGVKVPSYDGETLQQVSVGAGVLLGGLGGAALGTAGGFAAAGATTAAVMALGTASTGTAIASLSGAAATNATLAALGGGALAAGGGGMALGSAVLGAATLGVGLLVGGVIFGVTGSKISDQAYDAWGQMRRNEEKINEICAYLNRLHTTATEYTASLSTAHAVYCRYFDNLKNIVNTLGKTDWLTFTEEEKQCVRNTVLLVGLLYNMCKVELVLKSENEDEMNTINTEAVQKAKDDTNAVLHDLGEAA